LAHRTPPNNPLELALIAAGVYSAQKPLLDQRAATPTGRVIPPEYIGCFPCPPQASGHADRGIFIGPHDAPRDVEDMLVVNVPYSGCRMHPRNETGFGTVLVTNASHVALVEQCCPDGTSGTRREPAHGFFPIPPRQEDIGAQVSDGFVVTIESKDLYQA